MFKDFIFKGFSPDKPKTAEDLEAEKTRVVKKMRVKRFPEQRADVTEVVVDSIISIRDRRLQGLESLLDEQTENIKFSGFWTKTLDDVLTGMRSDPTLQNWKETADGIENPIPYYQYQVEAIERFVQLFDQDAVQKKLLDLEEQCVTVDDDSAERIQNDINTLKEIILLLPHGSAVLPQPLSNAEMFFNIIPPLMLGIERDLQQKPDTLTSEGREVMDRFIEVAHDHIDEVLVLLAKKHGYYAPERDGLCAIYSSKIYKEMTTDISIATSLADIGVAQIYKVNTARHVFLRLETITGEHFYWDPTMSQFFKYDKDEPTDEHSLGFIGTAHELRTHVKSAVAVGEVVYSDRPKLAYELYWNFGGLIDRQEQGFV